MRRITTRNSVYEVDEENKKVRRVEGTGTIPSLLATDGEWQDYEHAFQHPFTGGLGVWNKAGKGFITSTVLKDEEVAQ